MRQRCTHTLWILLALCSGTIDDLARLVKNETARYAGIAKRAGLRPE